MIELRRIIDSKQMEPCLGVLDVHRHPGIVLCQKYQMVEEEVIRFLGLKLS